MLLDRVLVTWIGASLGASVDLKFIQQAPAKGHVCAERVRDSEVKPTPSLGRLQATGRRWPSSLGPEERFYMSLCLTPEQHMV